MSKSLRYCAAVIIGIVACGAGCTDVQPAATPDESPPNNAANSRDASQLHGDIEIVFSKSAYKFTLAEAAKGVSIDYHIVIRRDLPGIVPLTQDVGHATLPGPSGLIPFEELSGNGHSYCLRDVGLGDPTPATPRTLNSGAYSRTFTWDGRNWSGPSDFDPPKGELFPVGQYTLRVSCVGQQVLEDATTDFAIESSVPVRLVD